MAQQQQQQAYVQPQPIPGYAIAPPIAPPRPGEVIIGWEVLPPAEGCSCDLNVTGLVTLVVLILVFWPLFFIPLLVPDCKNQRQRPIYGPPGSAPPAHVVTIPPVPTGAVATQPPQAGYYPPVQGAPVVGVPAAGLPPPQPAPAAAGPAAGGKQV